MQKIVAPILAHKRLVALTWVALTLVGIVASGPASKALDQKFSVPGREGWDTSQEIVRVYGNGGDTLPLVPVVKLPAGKTVDSPGVRAQLKQLEAKTGKSIKRGRVAGFGSTGDRAFVSKDGRTTFVYAFAPPSDDAFNSLTDTVRKLERDLRGTSVAGAPVRVTGYDALADSTGAGDDGPGVLLEAVLGGLGALVVLIFVFGSALALVPIAMAICSILVSFLLLWGLTGITEVSPIVQFLVALVGLGISIDYSLLVVVRWREELEKGKEGDEAVAAAMRTAGRAVVFSGTTVAVGLLALVALPLPFLRSMGYGGLIIPLVATTAAVTLLPVVLATIGPKLDKHRLRRGDRSSRFWHGWAEGIVRRRWAAAALAIAVLLALFIPATNIHMGNSDPDTIAKSGSARQGLHALRDSGIGTGAIAPFETLVPQADAQKVVAAQKDQAGMHGAVAPEGSQWRRQGLALVAGMPTQGDESKSGRDTVDRVRDASHDAAADVRVGGSGPLNADFIDAVYGAFPLMIALISLLTFLLLARAFRSLLLPLKAVILNVFSVGAAWGVMTLVWQDGHGSQLWGIDPTGSISSWIPLMVFAFLYGLSMDYEVFILARMREAFDSGGDTDKAVVEGLSRTGRLVTSAALILFLAFASMASGPETDVKILATGLAAGILLDATVVRALLVPAVVSLFGRWNWWLPPGPAKLLRVPPSPDTAPESAGG